MKKMKKLLALVLSLALMATLFAGCGAKAQDEGSSEGGDDAYKVGVTLQDMSNEFMVMVKEALEDAAANYPELEVTYVDGEGLAEKQGAQIETFVAQGMDVIIMCPQDGDALVPFVKSAVEAGVTFITISSDINEKVGQYFVGSDQKNGGKMEAQFAAEAMGGAGKVALIRGPIGHFAETERAKGMEEAFANYPDIEIIFDQPGDWDRDKGMNLMETWLTTDAGKEIDCVLAQNDDMGLGALRALEAAGMNDVIVVGMDAIKDALDSVVAGGMTATILQDSKGHASEAMKMAYYACTGAGEVTEVDVPWVVITSENAAEYYDAIG